MKAIYIQPQVERALQAGAPVVALESTVISHGFPYPENLETALAVEQAIREEGAIPATIAVLKGQVMVGLDRSQLEHFSHAKGIRKCSRRDLPITIGLGLDGATTVAGTMIVAHEAGIPIFSTGGIGGVHRGHPFDVSTDLEELARTEVIVVCAGAKAILDLPLTLERLETLGVPVLGYGTDEFPAFYSRSSGLPVDVRVDEPHEVARIARARQIAGIQGGLLVTVPVPLEDEWPAAEAEKVIAEATRQADELGVRGKALTPFLLARISELTGGRSQRANVSLLINNARVAAQIAVALASSRGE